MLLEINKLSKRFDNKVIFDDLSFKVNNGVTTIVGLNGIGKTTLMRIIVNLDKDFSGEINRNFKESSVCFSTNELPLYLSIYELVKSTNLSVERLNYYLKLFSIDQYKNTWIKDLSMGTKTKMNIIFAILWPSEILIFDEPTNTLDINSIIILIDLIKNESRDCILISHNLEFIKNVSDQILIIESEKSVIVKEKSEIENQDFMQIIKEIILKNESHT